MKDKNKKTKDMDGKEIKRKKKGMFIGKKLVKLLTLNNSWPTIRKGGG